MNLTYVPRLDNIVAVKIAIEVCNKRDVNILVRSLEEDLSHIFNLQSDFKQWKDIQTNIAKKISSFGLPKLLEKKLNGLIRPILLEIGRWKDDHCEILCTHIDLQAHFVWNIRGTIDRKRTAKALIKLKKFDIRNRFVLACHYFFEADIVRLWQKLSFCYEQTSVYDTDASPIVRYWVNWLKGQQMDWSYLASECVLYPPPNLFPRNALVFSSFLHLLPTLEKLPCLIFQINKRRINQSDLLLCLSKLEPNEQIQIFKACAKNILRHFVNWPLQNNFLEMADILWPYLSEQNFLHLLEFIIYRRISMGWSDFDYIGLLKEFWLSSSDSYKASIEKTSVFATLMEVINHDRTKHLPKEKLRKRFFACPVSVFKALTLSCTKGRMPLS